MGLYLGNNTKLKINLNGVKYCLNIGSPLPSMDYIRLLSNDGYILKDLNGLYLIPKQEVDSNVNGI